MKMLSPWLDYRVSRSKQRPLQPPMPQLHLLKHHQFLLQDFHLVGLKNSGSGMAMNGLLRTLILDTNMKQR
jgi:hypothetical protein